MNTENSSRERDEYKEMVRESVEGREKSLETKREEDETNGINELYVRIILSLSNSFQRGIIFHSKIDNLESSQFLSKV